MKKMRRVLAFLIAAVMAISNVPIDIQAAQNGRSHQTNLVRGLIPTVAWLNDETAMTEDETDSNTLERATDGTIDINNYLRYGEASEKKASYVQFDLGTECTISEIKMWRYWEDNRNYDPTAIVLSNSVDNWSEDIAVVYSSDDEDIFGFGTETVTESGGYVEESTGKTISMANPIIGRYVRIYSYGSNVNSGNHLVEFEVYGVINDGETQIPEIWITDSTGKNVEDVSVNANESLTLTVNGIPEGETVTAVSADDTMLTVTVERNQITLTGISSGATGIAETTVTMSTPTGGMITLNVEVVDAAAENLERITLRSGDSVAFPGAKYDNPVYDSNIVEVVGSSFNAPIQTEIEKLRVGQSTTTLLVLTGDDNAKYVMSSEADTGYHRNGLKIVAISESSDLGQYYWNVTKVADGYIFATVGETVRYINAADENVTLTDNQENATLFTFNIVENGYTISYSDNGGQKYFNKHGGGFYRIAGYDSADSAIFSVWQAETVITGLNEGTTTIRVGNTLYHIIVKEALGTYVKTLYLNVGETESVSNDSTDSTIEVGTYDNTIASVVLSADKRTITVTGNAEGYTIIDVGATRCYIYVTNTTKDSVISEESIIISVGQTKTFESTENGPNPVITDENYDVCLENVSITGIHQDLLAVRGTAVTSMDEIEAYYVGNPVDLSDCLYTFTSNGTENQYRITRKISNGSTVYFNHARATAPYANTTLETAIEVTNDGDGSFYLKDSTNETKYLSFSRDGKNQLGIVDAINDNCKFDLYCLDTAEELSNDVNNSLPGYVKVNSIENGKQYLIVASYVKGDKNYYYAIYPTLETGNHAQTVQIVPEQLVGNKYSLVSFTGKAVGQTILQVDNKTYYITVKEKSEVPDYDTTPVISLTGISEGSPLTKLAMSADRTFRVSAGNGYSATNVTWEIQNEDGSKAAWANITTDGTISASSQSESEKTYKGYIVATIDGYVCKVPFVLSPAPILSDGEASRQYDIYIEDVYHTDLYYGWIYGQDSGNLDANNNKIYSYSHTPLTPITGGELIYVSVSRECYTAIDFFGKPEDGYALTEMGATGSDGHYKRLEGATPANTEFITEAGVAGHTQYHYMDAEVTSALVQLAMDKGCDGAQGFTRQANAEGVRTILSYRSEKLPTLSKNIVGILGKDGLASSYRTYTPGMTAQVGEYVYYEIDVETYDSLTDINYSNVILKDTLDGATFYEKDPDAVTQTPTSQKGNEITITTEVEADGKEGKTHTYYVVYRIKEADLALEKLTNTVLLSYGYSSDYSSGQYSGSDSADADIIITDILLDNMVIDFGLPVKNEFITNDRYFESTTEAITTTYGTVTVASEEVTGTLEADGEDDTAVNTTVTKYKNVITYTPSRMLCGVDEVTLKLIEGDAFSYYTFYVYPANSVYYEEGFGNYSTGWHSTGSKGSDLQTLQQLKEDNDGHYGFDKKYALELTGPSNGTEAVSITAGKTTEFTFGGTGLDIYANCQGGSTPTGTVTVMIKNTDTQTIEKLMIVNTKVAGSDDGVTISQNSINIAYGLPIVSTKDLISGNHTVRIGHTRTKAESEAGVDNPVKIDGFRVYNTLSDQRTYAVHNETDPQYVEMRNVVLNALGIADLYDTDKTDGESIYAEDIAAGLKQVLDKTETGAGVVIVDSTLKADGYTSGDAQDLLDNGPKGEIFLYKGQSLVMGLNAGLKNVQIGLKAINSAVTLQISKQVQGQDTVTVLNPSTISSSTDMYYVIGDLDSATTITISNNDAEVGILSVTDLKYFVGTDSAQIFYELTETDFLPMLFNAGYKQEILEETAKPGNTSAVQNNSKGTSSETTSKDEKTKEVYEYVANNDTSAVTERVEKKSTKTSKKDSNSSTIEVAEAEKTEVAEIETDSLEKSDAPDGETKGDYTDKSVKNEKSSIGVIIASSATVVLFSTILFIIFALKKKQKK